MSFRKNPPNHPSKQIGAKFQPSVKSVTPKTSWKHEAVYFTLTANFLLILSSPLCFICKFKIGLQIWKKCVNKSYLKISFKKSIFSFKFNNLGSLRKFALFFFTRLRWDLLCPRRMQSIRRTSSGNLCSR